MKAISVLLVALCVVATAGVAGAAPAPLARPVHNVPSPGALLTDFRAEGFPVTAVERGPEPGTYVITLQLRVENDEQRAIVAHRRSVVRVGTNVRADLREFLQKAPRTITMTSSGRRIKR